MSAPVRFALIGGGWRAEFFLRIARALPERFAVTGIYSRTESSRTRFAQQWGIPAADSIDALLKAQPDFVVLSVPRKTSADLILELAAKDVPVLGETPPAELLDDMTRLWQKLPRGAKVQVAEQYPFQPYHAACLAIAGSDRLGTISQAQVSAAHGYHGVVLIRKYLGVGLEPATISGFEFTSPIVEGPGRGGPPAAEKLGTSHQAIVRLQFGDKLAIFDFTGDQYFSWVRTPRLLVRGERGEINNREVSYLIDHKTPVHFTLRREEAGQGGNLEGHHLKGYLGGERWWYTNPFVPGRLADDEIAVASCLEKMARYVATGESFYSLAEACQDHYLGLLLEEAVKTGATITSQPQAWHG